MRKITVRAVIIYKGKQFLVRHKPYNQSKQVDYYCTIGGHLEDGESLTEGLAREIFEETGVKPDIGRLLYIHQFYKNDGAVESIEFFFLVKDSEDFISVDLAKSTHGLDEIEEVGYFDASSVHVLPEFLKDIDLDNISLSRDVEIYSYL